MTGSVLTVEQRKSQIDANKAPVVTHSLVVASESGELSSFDLADIKAVRLLDEGTKRDVTEFASVSASARRRDAKTIVVTSEGSGMREMVISYVISAPIWKTTYRVVLDSTGQPFFQGWAIVDNVSDEDWTNVSLSLISGSPVSFIQPIQQPLYRYRPVVSIKPDLKLSPQTYESGELNAPRATTSSIIGGITDPSGASVPGVTVTAEDKDSGSEYTGVTDNEGNFRIGGLPASTYDVAVSHPGFKNYIVTGITVSGLVQKRIDFALEVGSVSEAVTVTSSSAVDTEASSNQNEMLLSSVGMGRAMTGGVPALWPPPKAVKSGDLLSIA
ncbi:MAG: carboxypeptidase regulatory-like domain-containing protein [Pyrinomonadaceae bacterium]